MKKVVFTEDFRFSPNGYDVIDYAAGAEPVEVSERCAEVAIAAGAAKEPTSGDSTRAPAPKRGKGKA